MNLEYARYILHGLLGENTVRTIRIYEPGQYENGQTIELSAAASQHVAVVLRMKPGDPLTLFCGDNREFHASIVEIHKKKVVVMICDVQTIDRESPCKIHLAQAISKGDRMEWVVQKSVELGVTSIIPLLTTHCVVKLDADRFAKKRSQWQAIAVAACEQSGRNTVPIIYPAMTLETYLQQCNTPMKLVLHPTTSLSLQDKGITEKDIALLIGPEGGLSDDEVKHATTLQFQPWCLGPRILRTETAAIAALSVLQSLGGDL